MAHSNTSDHAAARPTASTSITKAGSSSRTSVSTTAKPGRLERFDLETGARDILLAAVEGRSLTASNYPLIDSAGNIWCANSTGAATWPEALDGRADGFVYVLRPDGTSGIVADRLKFPNGLAISADERTLFCCQTTGADVLRFPILPGGNSAKASAMDPGSASFRPLRRTRNLRLPGFITRFLGYTDGCGMDAEGNLWVTLPAAHKIVAITPSGPDDYPCSRSRRETARRPTNVAWGGPDMCDLYIGSLSAPYVLKGRSPVPGLKLVHQRWPPALQPRISSRYPVRPVSVLLRTQGSASPPSQRKGACPLLGSSALQANVAERQENLQGMAIKQAEKKK